MLRCRRSIASMALSDGMCARQLQGLIRGTRTDFFRRLALAHLRLPRYGVDVEVPA